MTILRRTWKGFSMGVTDRIRSLGRELDRLQGFRAHAAKSLQEQKARLDEAETRVAACKGAQAILQEVAKKTQEQLQYRISELATLALAGVLDNPYSFVLEFDAKASSTAATFYFERDGAKVPPIDASGGGAVDIASLVLRMTMWSLMRPRTSNCLILDEPLKWLKGGDMPVKGAVMLQEISHRLGIQVVMVSHSPELIDGADNIIEIKRRTS